MHHNFAFCTLLLFWGFVFSKLEKNPLSLVNPFLFSSQKSTNSFKALKHYLCGGSERRSKVKAGWVFIIKKIHIFLHIIMNSNKSSVLK